MFWAPTRHEKGASCNDLGPVLKNPTVALGMKIGLPEHLALRGTNRNPGHTLPVRCGHPCGGCHRCLARRSHLYASAKRPPAIVDIPPKSPARPWNKVLKPEVQVNCTDTMTFEFGISTASEKYKLAQLASVIAGVMRTARLLPAWMHDSLARGRGRSTSEGMYFNTGDWMKFNGKPT